MLCSLTHPLLIYKDNLLALMIPVHSLSWSLFNLHFYMRFLLLPVLWNIESWMHVQNIMVSDIRLLMHMDREK